MVRWLYSGLMIGVIILLSACVPRNALWGVVDKLCRVNYQQKRDPAPCDEIYLPQGDAKQAFSVIQNPRFPYHFVLVPNIPIRGVEDANVLSDKGTDYFGYAWTMRYRMIYAYGRPISENRLGLAINSAYGRSQDQLHIHLSCLREDVYRQLKAERPYIGDQWALLPDTLLHHHYYAKRILQPALFGVYPLHSLAQHFQLTSAEMARYGVAVVPTTFDGQAGFILLATRAGMDVGNYGSVEALLDTRCTNIASSLQ